MDLSEVAFQISYVFFLLKMLINKLKNNARESIKLSKRILLTQLFLKKVF